MLKIMWSGLSSLLLWGGGSGVCQAYDLITAEVASGYNNCSLVDNGNGTSTASVAISFNKVTAENTANMEFYSRGLLFYSYNKDGSSNNTKAHYAAINGYTSTEYFPGNGYLIYKKYADNMGYGWRNNQAFVANASVVFPNSILKSWAAVAIRAGNYTVGNDVGEITGGAYISAGDDTGSCKVVVDPTHPPAPTIAISVNAPDWNLGEIKRGEQNIPFSASKDYLCLQYADAAVASKQFIITASSQNGEMNNQYQLINQNNAAQIIPYQLTLDSGSQQLTMPGATNKRLPLQYGGKTCFMPTFKTFAPNSIKKGDYSDVLTFNIVTKS